jgi:hypothetical protein
VLRRCFLAAIGVLLVTASTSAQQWADSLVADKTHDFGAVARAAKVEHVFQFKNASDRPIHLSSCRSSCGCTQPRVGKATAAPGEVATVIAAFNTRGFTGKRGAWVTVTLDQPQYAEVRLRIDGYIRTDVVLDPGQVSFGSVAVGKAAEKTVRINYAGRNDWKIEDVKSASPFVAASVIEKARSGGRISYDLVVKLKQDAPVGYLNNELLLVTNDRRATQVPVKVEGVVVANLAISPSPLMLGSMQPGQVIQRQLIVKGTKPFKITGIAAEDPGFSFKPSGDSKLVHVVPLEFKAGPSAQTLVGRILVQTDMPEAPTGETAVKGQVNAPLATN